MFLEKTSENFDFLLTSEILVFKLINNSTNIKARIKAIITSEVSKVVKERRRAPVRKPNPLTAFLDPVIRETHLNNFEFLSINSSLNKNLQFVCKKNKQLYFVIVKVVLYPNNPKTFQIKNLKKILDHSKKFDAKLLSAKVGLANSEDYELPLFKNSSYVVNYHGFEEIN